MKKCTLCGEQAEYQAVPNHISLTPLLCKEHMQELSIDENIEDNEFFERIIEVNEIKKVIV